MSDSGESCTLARDALRLCRRCTVDLVRIVAISAAIGSVALLAAGCGGSSERVGDATSAGDSGLAVSDLRLLVTVSPEATGWQWRAQPRTRLASPSPPDQSNPSYGIQQKVFDAYQAAGLVKTATSDWIDTARKASSFAYLVATASGARSALAANFDFAHSWFPQFEHREVHDVDTDGIGEQSWGVRGGGDTVGFVEIAWTRANAVLSVYVSCSPCQSDVAEAARRWARAIDDAAQTAAV